MVNNLGLNGNFWSSSLYTENAENAWNLGFNPDEQEVNNDNRFNGLPLRGVC